MSTTNNTPLREVKDRMSIFVTGHRQAQHDAADLVDAICKAMDFDDDHRKRVRDAFLGRPRKKIKFSEARKRMGVKDARAWHKRCNSDPVISSIEIMWETEKSAYCWEDEVNAALAKLNGPVRNQLLG